MHTTKTAERRLIYILNPAAGRGSHLKEAERAAESAGADHIHYTTYSGHCRDFIAEAAVRDPDTHFVIFGGDGTAGEAVNGLMLSGENERARITVMPGGSGNDFCRGIAGFTVPEGQDSIPLDLIESDGRYVINILNTGMDCDVVVESEAIRRRHVMSNSASYIYGVAKAFFKKKAFDSTVTFTDVITRDDPTPKTEMFKGKVLVCAIANLPYYGGGFKGVPLADPTDGYLDVLVARDMTHLKFASIIGAYHDGRHMDPATWLPHHAYAPLVEYKRCRAVTVSGTERICLDGEVREAETIVARCVPHAIRYVPLKPEL